MKVEGGL